MAKETPKTSTALAKPLVGILAIIGTPATEGGEIAEIKGAKKLNLPPLLKPKDIPQGVTISGVIEKVVENFTGKDSLRGTKSIHLIHTPETGPVVEFLFPITRGMTSAMKAVVYDGEDKDAPADGLKRGIAGKTLYLTRTPDSFSKAHPDKAQFNFDIRLSS